LDLASTSVTPPQTFPNTARIAPTSDNPVPAAAGLYQNKSTHPEIYLIVHRGIVPLEIGVL